MILNPESIEIDDIKEVILFSGFRPNSQKSVLRGFVLAQDLVNPKGGILYPKGTELDDEKITRLLRFLEMNDDWKFTFTFAKGDELKETIKSRILGDIARLLKAKAGKQEFVKFISRAKSAIEKYGDDIFTVFEPVIMLLNAKFNEQMNSKDKLSVYYNHTLNTAIVTIGIIQQSIQRQNYKFTAEDIVRATQVSLFHSLGGLETVPFFLERSKEEQKTRYLQGLGNSGESAKRFALHEDIVAAIEMIDAYFKGSREMISQDTPATAYANVVIVAHHFHAAISGLFGEPGAVKNSVDQLYVATQGQESQYVKTFVDSLAQGLTFGDLFDFYYEIEKLENSCDYQGGKHGVPYPMTGFQSPVIFVCKAQMTKCPHYSASAKAVTIFKETGKLKEGAYGRCDKLAKGLIKFYDEHYEQIKEETMSRPTDST